MIPAATPAATSAATSVVTYAASNTEKRLTGGNGTSRMTGIQGRIRIAACAAADSTDGGC